MSMDWPTCEETYDVNRFVGDERCKARATVPCDMCGKALCSSHRMLFSGKSRPLYYGNYHEDICLYFCEDCVKKLRADR